MTMFCSHFRYVGGSWRISVGMYSSEFDVLVGKANSRRLGPWLPWLYEKAEKKRELFWSDARSMLWCSSSRPRTG
jgi:hypothetical protein